MIKGVRNYKLCAPILLIIKPKSHEQSSTINRKYGH